MRINIEMNKGLRTVRKKAWVMKGVLLSFVLSLLVVSLLAGSVSAGTPLLHIEHVNDLIEASTVIYDNTGKIADDAKLDKGLRAKAEEIRMASGKLGNIAEVIHEHMKELETFISDPEANKAKIKEALDEVVERLEKCYVILEAKDDLVHAIIAVAPESHKEYADAIHDTYHEAGRIVKQLTENAQELAKVVGIAISESAIKPVAAPEQYIQIYDEQGNLQNLLAEEVAVEAHGHLCVCGATAFRVTQVAIAQLWDQEIPTKGELAVTYHHPGKGHKEVFEYLLGPENVTYVKAGDPKHLTLEDNYVYTFIRKDTGATWETAMKEGVIPAGFFDLRYQVKGFLNGWHKEKPTKLLKVAFKQKFDKAVNNILSMEASEVFEGVGVGEIAAEYQEDIEELTASAKELKKLIRRMIRPAHAIPGDAGAGIHDQFHRCEGFVLAIYNSVLELKKLAADPDRNKEEIRELVVVELWDQLGSEMFGGLAKAMSGMSEFIEQALAADPEDTNAKKVQDILDEMVDTQDTILEQVSELAAKVQAPIVWEYRNSMGAMNASRLANGNTLINEAFADQVIEVSPAGEIVWEYTEVVYPTDSERLENGNTLIADKGNKRIIEVTPDKEIIWEYLGDGQELTALYGVRALNNGNVLIADQGNMQDPNSRARIIEVNPDKEIVWEYSGPAMEFICPSLGGRLENGNTLIADNTGMMEGKDVYVREITPDKEIAWEYSEGLTCVYVVHRLANGNTLINAQCDGRIIEVTPDGEIVWMYRATNLPAGMQRLENGNTLIAIFGENRVIEIAAP
ncbi:MAG: NHL repeat-containing protein [Candidatus Methanospirareceae archaeon]